MEDTKKTEEALTETAEIQKESASDKLMPLDPEMLVLTVGGLCASTSSCF